jgi:hypothetical protein
VTIIQSENETQTSGETDVLARYEMRGSRVPGAPSESIPQPGHVLRFLQAMKTCVAASPLHSSRKLSQGTSGLGPTGSLKQVTTTAVRFYILWQFQTQITILCSAAGLGEHIHVILFQVRRESRHFVPRSITRHAGREFLLSFHPRRYWPPLWIQA